ncbi:MAG: ABC transporter permease, partial [Marinosulfonomonas sp.]|nr:ABC transporter permease [Marinosulfonomonas sp.]
MTGQTAPFARYEWMIAWRYLRAKRAEGGVSIMTWISLIGITLAVAALIITLAVRAGFRAEFVDTILGANAHVTVYNSLTVNDAGATTRVMADYEAKAEAIRMIPGVTRVAPLIKGQVMANHRSYNTGAQVLGIKLADLKTIPRIASGTDMLGDI